MKWLVYNLLFALIFPLLLPGFLLRMFRRGGYRARMGDRFAIYPRELIRHWREPGARFVWVHAVSVGEVQVAGQLMREWRRADATVRFCFSTTSSTGWRMAERELASGDTLIYNPLDFPSFVKSALSAVRPAAIVLVESELWPNFIRFAARRKVPVYLVNARVSDRSAPRYRRVRWFFGEVLRAFTRIFAQSELDRARLIAAGARPDAVEISGSFKFDVARRAPEKEAELTHWMGRDSGGQGPLLVGGSTWPGEDEVLVQIYRRLLDSAPPGAPAPRLCLAPRHFEKADEVEATIRRTGFECVRRSRGDAARPAPAVFLADTTGELMGLYGLADWVFVGKSLTAHGSQNMIEPCLCGKPTAVGPYTENFRPVMSDLLAAEAIVQVPDAAALGEMLLRWQRAGDGGLGERAAAAVARRRGVVARCLEPIRAGAAAAQPRFGHDERLSGWLGLTLKSAAALLMLLTAAGLFVTAGDEWRARRRRATARERIARLRDSAKAAEPAEVRTAAVAIALLEKADAKRVLTAGPDAGDYARILRQSGVETVSVADEQNPDSRFDVVFVAGEVAPDGWLGLAKRVNRRGVLVWSFDVRGVSAGEFNRRLMEFPAVEAHLWMPDEFRWVLAGRLEPRAMKMSALLDCVAECRFFSSPAAVKAGCDSLPGIFANYAGTREDVLPAFAGGDLGVEVRPEYFLTRELPDIRWIVPGDMDGEMVAEVTEAIRRNLSARRLVAGAGIAGASAQAATPEALREAALRNWAAAARENPRDPMLTARLYRTAVNAQAFASVGNFAGAAICYENILRVRPYDIAVAEAYARCLDLLGRRADAQAVAAQAAAMRKEATHE